MFERVVRNNYKYRGFGASRAIDIVTIAIQKGRSGNRLSFSMPVGLAKELGWRQSDRLSLLVGRGPDKGKGQVELDNDGYTMSINNSHKTRLNVRFPVIKGLVSDENRGANEIEYKVEEGANGKVLQLTLPHWFYAKEGAK